MNALRPSRSFFIIMNSCIQNNILCVCNFFFWYTCNTIAMFVQRRSHAVSLFFRCLFIFRMGKHSFRSNNHILMFTKLLHIRVVCYQISRSIQRSTTISQLMRRCKYRRGKTWKLPLGRYFRFPLGNIRSFLAITINWKGDGCL